MATHLSPKDFIVASGLFKGLKKAPIFDITDAAQAVYDGTDAMVKRVVQEHDRFDPAAAFAGLKVRPPFENLWIQSTEPAWILGTAETAPWACAIERHHRASETDIAKEGEEWYSITIMFARGRGKVLPLPMRVGFHVGPEGELQRAAVVLAQNELVSQWSVAAADSGGDPGNHIENANLIAGQMGMIVLRVFAMLNCKNVVTDEITPSPEQHREVYKACGEACSIYRVLRLDTGPRTVYLKDPNAPEHEPGPGGQKKAHMVRGHFATYTPEAPLFGRVVGQFWVPQHARGNKQRGSVVKDYSVTGTTSVKGSA